MKKVYKWYVLGAAAAVYLGYLFSGVMPPGTTLMALDQERMLDVFQHPFGNYFNENTGKMVMLALGIYVCWMLWDMARPKKYRLGREHGSAAWGDVEDLSRRLKSKREMSNRILSEHLRISLDTHMTQINNNMMVIGGSGAGKSTAILLPNIHNISTSMVITDPKGELLRTLGGYLQHEGVMVKVLDLINMKQSVQYNPFVYLRDQASVRRLISNIFENTKDKGASKGEQIWEDAAKMYLEALFLYVWLERPKPSQNIPEILRLMSLAKVDEECRTLGELDQIFSVLPQDHPARETYCRMMQAAGDTVRSVLFTANARMQAFYNEDLQHILQADQIDLASLGIGYLGDKKTKTVIFCVIPDSDKTYNFIVGMLYTQLFNELYYQADILYAGRLPIPVTIWMDEFANVALPDDFVTVNSTVRSREIYLSIILQNISQLKALFKDYWETILGNCDQMIYLGGNDPGTFEYISKLLDHETIDKRSESQSMGRSPGSSKSHDTLQRSLMTPGEVRKLSKKDSLILIRGEDPVIDRKYQTFRKKWFIALKQVPPYKAAKREEQKKLQILNQSSLNHFLRLQENGENVVIYEIPMEDLARFKGEKITKEFRNYGVAAAEDSETGSKTEERKRAGSVIEYMLKYDLDSAQQKEVQEGIRAGLSEQEILLYLKPFYTSEQMRERRLLIQEFLG
ncbi:VirD4-like conjugal transfer protein, CD1115 family [Cuneatibacter caecimuris]|uniref:Type IV secretion system protein VirD4 n=1 Tax=Cuneatibacter caecimuris TaxID=1796618 RepID=A0A4Q7PKB4_9FIRM|nr:type IV secretory system conjugative DNA transfer family protein [Cuneatibacter caecimuris]RZT01163.1 type IV secretion system protein VirD4 [Cuneatibacter caecimuris]